MTMMNIWLFCNLLALAAAAEVNLIRRRMKTREIKGGPVYTGHDHDHHYTGGPVYTGKGEKDYVYAGKGEKVYTYTGKGEKQYVYTGKGEKHYTGAQSRNQRLEICHRTEDPNCPMRNLEIDASDIFTHVFHGDRIGRCENSCDDCYEWDAATCRCVFATCIPTYAPTYYYYSKGGKYSPYDSYDAPSYAPTDSKAGKGYYSDDNTDNGWGDDYYYVGKSGKSTNSPSYFPTYSPKTSKTSHPTEEYSYSMSLSMSS